MSFRPPPPPPPPQDPSNFGQSCSENVCRQVGISVLQVQQCVLSSGGTADSSPLNTLLRVEANTLDELPALQLPTVTVNGIILRGTPWAGWRVMVGTSHNFMCVRARAGNMVPENAFNAVCAGFAAGTAPLVCNCPGSDLSLKVRC